LFIGGIFAAIDAEALGLGLDFFSYFSSAVPPQQAVRLEKAFFFQNRAGGDEEEAAAEEVEVEAADVEKWVWDG
jgi:hypothetical protein